MDPNLFPGPDRPIRVSDWVSIPFLLICISSFLLPPGAPRLVLTFPAILYLVFRVRTSTSGNQVEDYILAVNACGLIYKYVSFVVLKTPEFEIHRVFMSGAKKGSKIPEDPVAMEPWDKLKWSIQFWTSLRGVGWNWQVKNVDELPEKLLSKRWVLPRFICDEDIVDES